MGRFCPGFPPSTPTCPCEGSGLEWGFRGCYSHCPPPSRPGSSEQPPSHALSSPLSQKPVVQRRELWVGEAGRQGPARLGHLTVSLWPQAEPSPGPRVRGSEHLGVGTGSSRGPQLCSLGPHGAQRAPVAPRGNPSSVCLQVSGGLGRGTLVLGVM